MAAHDVYVASVSFAYLNDMKNKIKKAEIFNEAFGSDHCPVGLKINF